MIVTIVHMPNFPPSKTPVSTITISSIIRTVFTCQPFFSAREKSFIVQLRDLINKNVKVLHVL